jgi:hypothetical protein
MQEIKMKIQVTKTSSIKNALRWCDFLNLLFCFKR